MPKTYLLDKCFKVGTLYRSEPDKYFVIDKVGTDSGTKATLKIAGAVALELLDILAKPQVIGYGQWPPIDLGSLFCVIPRDKPFEVTGEAGKLLRAIGRILELAPGEVEATRDLARFGEQVKKFLTYQTGTGGIGENDNWAPGAEYTVMDFTCPSGEKHIFNRFMHVEAIDMLYDKGPGSIGLRWKINDAPLDVIDPSLAPLGIDMARGYYWWGGMPYLWPFSVAEMPVELMPGKNLKITAVNISGAPIGTGAGRQAKVAVTILDEKELL